MTTTPRPTVSLAPVTAAVTRAKDLIEHGAAAAEVQDALVALCHEAHDALTQAAGAAAEALTPSVERMSWRTPLDELRVQVALVEMELKDSAQRGVEIADGLVHAVDKGVASAVADLGDALGELRSELRRAAAR